MRISRCSIVCGGVRQYSIHVKVWVLLKISIEDIFFGLVGLHMVEVAVWKVLQHDGIDQLLQLRSGGRFRLAQEFQEITRFRTPTKKRAGERLVLS